MFVPWLYLQSHEQVGLLQVHVLYGGAEPLLCPHGGRGGQDTQGVAGGQGLVAQPVLCGPVGRAPLQGGGPTKRGCLNLVHQHIKISHFLITVHFLYLFYTSMAEEHRVFKIKYNYHYMYLFKSNGTSLVHKE